MSRGRRCDRVLISNHTAFDDAWIKGPARGLASQRQAQPFVVGTQGVANYFKVMEECPVAWESLLPPK